MCEMFLTWACGMVLDTHMTNSTGIYVMGIDWENGRTPSYEAHLRWKCDETAALRYFSMNADSNRLGLRAALIAPDGRIVTETP